MHLLEHSPGMGIHCASPDACSAQVEIEIPVLADQLLAELIVLPAADQLEAGLLVDVAGGDEHAVGPERDLAVARVAREAHAFLDQPRADAEPARLRLDQQEAQ